jgi:PEP-CTERM motif
MGWLRNIKAALVAAISAAGISATPAAAADSLTYVDFVGKCSDCAGYGLGVITLKNYTLGADLTAANFVDLTYASNLISFDTVASDLDEISGEFDFLPNSQATINIESFDHERSDGSVYGYALVSHGQIGPYAPSWEIDEPIPGPNGEGLPAGTKGGSNADVGGDFTYSLARNGDLPNAPIPEPAAWTLIIAGFGLAGAALRRRRQAEVAL